MWAGVAMAECQKGKYGEAGIPVLLEKELATVASTLPKRTRCGRTLTVSPAGQRAAATAQPASTSRRRALHQDLRTCATAPEACSCSQSSDKPVARSPPNVSAGDAAS